MKLTALILVAIAACMLPAISNAEAKKAKGDVFSKADADLNGSISISEADSNKKLKRNFKKLDTDGNGELSKAEFDAMKKTKKGEGQKKKKKEKIEETDAE